MRFIAFIFPFGNYMEVRELCEICGGMCNNFYSKILFELPRFFLVSPLFFFSFNLSSFDALVGFVLWRSFGFSPAFLTNSVNRAMASSRFFSCVRNLLA